MAPVHGHGRIPFMAMAMAKIMVLSLSHPHNYRRRMPWRMAWAHPREDFARIDRFRESKLAGVGGRSGGSLPSIGAIIEHQDF